MEVEASTSTASASGSGVSEGTPVETGENDGDFLSTGRTGRRNALPDILEEKSSHLNTADLPCQLEKLSCSDSPSSSQAHNGESGVSKVNPASDCSTNQNK